MATGGVKIGAAAAGGGGGDSSSNCAETILAFALLQYRQLDGAGWSRPLATKVPPPPPPAEERFWRADRRMSVCE